MNNNNIFFQVNTVTSNVGTRSSSSKGEDFWNSSSKLFLSFSLGLEVNLKQVKTSESSHFGECSSYHQKLTSTLSNLQCSEWPASVSFVVKPRIECTIIYKYSTCTCNCSHVDEAESTWLSAIEKIMKNVVLPGILLGLHTFEHGQEHLSIENISLRFQ